MEISSSNKDSNKQKVVRKNHLIKMNQQAINVCVFARTSSEGSKEDRQSYTRQLNELQEYCTKRNWTVTKVIASKISGSKDESKRIDIKELIEGARQGLYTKVLLDETSRLGRVAKIIRRTIDSLHELGVSIVFRNLSGMESLDENGNETFITNVVISLYAEQAQEEKRILSQRVKSGLREAIRKGKTLGRPKGSHKPKELMQREYSKLLKDLQAGISLRKCMKIHGVSKNTVIKVKRKCLAQ